VKSYLLDEISAPNMEVIRKYLEENAIKSGMEKIFWVQIPNDLLSTIQYEHKECQPYAFAVELGKDWIRLEFLIRSLTHMQCHCSGYCTEEQRNFLIGFADKMIDTLNISV